MELEHKAYWEIKELNLDFKSVGDRRKWELSELEELRLNATKMKIFIKKEQKNGMKRELWINNWSNENLSFYLTSAWSYSLESSVQDGLSPFK